MPHVVDPVHVTVNSKLPGRVIEVKVNGDLAGVQSGEQTLVEAVSGGRHLGWVRGRIWWVYTVLVLSRGNTPPPLHVFFSLVASRVAPHVFPADYAGATCEAVASVVALAGAADGADAPAGAAGKASCGGGGSGHADGSGEAAVAVYVCVPGDALRGGTGTGARVG